MFIVMPMGMSMILYVSPVLISLRYVQLFSEEFNFLIDRLCVIGLAPHHVAFKDKGGIVSVDFNVGKSDRSGIKVTGKRKKVKFLFLFHVLILQIFLF